MFSEHFSAFLHHEMVIHRRFHGGIIYCFLLLQKITSSVELRDTAPSDIVKITYFSSCLGKTTERTNICSGLKVGSQVQTLNSIDPGHCIVHVESFSLV